MPFKARWSGNYASPCIYQKQQVYRRRNAWEAQTALWNEDICLIVEILWKTASPRKISLKTSNRLLNYHSIMAKTIFNMAAVCSL